MRQNIIIAVVLIAVLALALTSVMLMDSPVQTAEDTAEPTVADSTTEPTQIPEPTEADSPSVSLALSEYRVLLNWPPIDGADGYYVYCDDGSGFKDFGKAEITSFRKKGLKGGTYYTFGIKAYSMKNGKEVISDDMLTVSGTTLPDIPVFTAAKNGSTYTLTWKAVNNADHYIVCSSTDGDNWTDEGTTKETTFSFDKADISLLYTAVKAVVYSGSKEYISDYTKTPVSDKATKGKVCSYGDSIAVGIGSHNYSYADIFAEEHDLTLVDKSNPGSVISSSNPDKHHIAESIISDVTPEYDYVLIEGGNNDHYFESPLGKVTPDGTTELDMNTTCGALEAAFSYLKEKCPDTKAVFILIHKRSPLKNSSGLLFEDYAEAITAVCKKYGVPVADCLNDSGMDTSDPEICKQYTHKFNGVFPDGDGVHPSEEAYRKFYMPLIDKVFS